MTITSQTVRSEIEEIVARIKMDDDAAIEELQGRLLSAAKELGSIEAVETAVCDLIDEAAKLDALRHEAAKTTEVETVKKETSEERAKRECRTKLGKIFDRYQLFDAGMVCKNFTLDADGKTLAENARIIKDAIDEIGSIALREKHGEWAERVAWKLFYLLRDEAHRLAMEKAERLVSGFVRNLEKIAWAMETAQRVRHNKDVWAKYVSEARQVFDWANETYFPWYILGAIEKMIDGRDNAVVRILMEPDIARSLADVKEGERAKALVAALKKRLASLGKNLVEIESNPSHTGPMRPGKTEPTSRIRPTKRENPIGPNRAANIRKP